MIIILSQKIDTDSTYLGDEVFKTYHYPKRYRNQIHTGDTFVYYQGNQYDKSQRYYFGTGLVGNIVMDNDENYFAELQNVVRFVNKVPIYLPDEGYVESLGYDSVRNSPNPPWQSSIRPLSDEAYRYILQHSGSKKMIETYEIKLKKAIQKYYVENDKTAILEVIEIAQKIANLNML